MSKKTEPVSLGAAIEALVRSLGIGGKLKEYEIVEVWPGIVGERIAQISCGKCRAWGGNNSRVCCALADGVEFSQTGNSGKDTHGNAVEGDYGYSLSIKEKK